MQVQQSLDGIEVGMITYRPSRLGQLLSALILLGSLVVMVAYTLPTAMLLGSIVAALVFLLAGTLTGPTVQIRLTDRMLHETISGETRSWPLEELRDFEEERWSVLERRMGQIRFSTESGSEVIGGGNRWEEIRWLGRVVRMMSRQRREQLVEAQPDAPITVRPPPEILEMLKR